MHSLRTSPSYCHVRSLRLMARHYGVVGESLLVSLELLGCKLNGAGPDSLHRMKLPRCFQTTGFNTKKCSHFSFWGVEHHAIWNLVSRFLGRFTLEEVSISVRLVGHHGTGKKLQSNQNLGPSDIVWIALKKRSDLRVRHGVFLI
jgi:hypothetical protein